MQNPVAAPSDSDQLRRRMQKIRNRMHAKVDGLKLDAESLTDWRYYVCQFPLSSTLTAAALGFWLMPGRRVTPIVKLDNRTIDNIVERGAARLEPVVKPWWKSLLLLGATFAAKSALAYAGQQLLQQMAPPSTPSKRRPVHDSPR